MLMTGAASVALGLTLPGPSQAQDLSEEAIIFDNDAPVLGNPKGDVTVVEYFDYQCGYCKSLHPTLKKVVKADGKVRLLLKDWPVFGEASVFAAQAVLGAAEIGKYELALDALMGIKGRLTSGEVKERLAASGIAMADIVAAVNANSKKINGLLDRNYRQADAFDFIGTPSFVIGRTTYPGVLDEKALTTAIAEARAA
jgi:protein-disulfide isomerase